MGPQTPLDSVNAAEVYACPDPPSLLRAAILFIIAYLVYFAKIGQNPQGPYQEPTLLRKIIALYAFNTAVVEARPGLHPAALSACEDVSRCLHCITLLWYLCLLSGHGMKESMHKLEPALLGQPIKHGRHRWSGLISLFVDIRPAACQDQSMHVPPQGRRHDPGGWLPRAGVPRGVRRQPLRACVGRCAPMHGRPERPAPKRF